MRVSRDGETGRRAAFRALWEQSHGGSNPLLGTIVFLRTWRNWYTRTLEVRMAERLWRFNSSRPHHAFAWGL